VSARPRLVAHVAVWALALAAVIAVWTVWREGDQPSALWRAYFPLTAVRNAVVSAVILGVAYVCRPGGWRGRLPRLLLVASSVGLSFACLELPVLVAGLDYGRVLGTHPNDTWLQLANGVNLRDDELIHVHRPHSRYTGEVVGNLTWIGIPARPPYRVDVAYDRHGFRNGRDLDRADVVAIGDSFVEGAEVADAETVTAVMTRHLGVEVANLGQSNYGPQQELAVLRRFGLPLAPRVVVWFFFGGNDLADVETYAWRRSHADEFLSPPMSIATRSFARNAVIALARLTTPPRTVESPAAVRAAMDFTEASGVTQRLYVDDAEGPWAPAQWDTARQTLDEAQRLTQAAGARFLLVFIPRKLRVYQGHVAAAPASLARTLTSNDLPRVLASWAAATGAAYLDATVPLRAAVAAGTSVYLPDDVHWSPDGHAVTGAAVAAAITAMDAVRPPPGHGHGR
jgi:lysophospholipase L1-like esterase